MLLRFKFLAFIWVCFFGSFVFSASNAVSTNVKPSVSVSVLLKNLEGAIAGKDFLAARIIVKQIAETRPNLNVYNQVLSQLTRNQQIGFDLLFKWMSFKSTLGLSSEVEKKVKANVADADALMLKEEFGKAFSMYQKLARGLKKELQKGNVDNFLFYQSTIHSMARALYGSGRYKDAYEVYTWIDPRYPKYRQVLFEKMWSAFMQQDIPNALGAIASQKTSYFSLYLEPESYLIQIYIYKKLCRESEIVIVRKEIEELRDKLKSLSKIKITDWAKFDLENFNLYKLLIQKPTMPNIYGISQEKRSAERKKINEALESRIRSESARLMKQVDMVLAYSYLALAADNLKLVGQSDLSRDELAKQEKEMWRLDDAEDWVDEIGKHIYVGKSLCKSEKSE